MYRPNFQGLCHVFNNCLGPKKLPFWFPVFSFRILVSMASPYMTDRRASGGGASVPTIENIVRLTSSHGLFRLFHPRTFSRYLAW